MLYRCQLAQTTIFPSIFGGSAEGTAIRVPGEATARWQTRDTANIAPLGRTNPLSLGRAQRAEPHGAPSAEPAGSVRDEERPRSRYGQRGQCRIAELTTKVGSQRNLI